MMVTKNRKIELYSLESGIDKYSKFEALNDEESAAINDDTQDVMDILRGGE